MNNTSKFLKNLMAAFLAQGISLLTSVCMSFVLPKFLGIMQYGYWQLFIFYTSYVGFFHFGFNDGLYLRIGGKQLEELDSDEIGTQFKLFLIMELVISISAIFISSIYFTNPERRFI